MIRTGRSGNDASSDTGTEPVGRRAASPSEIRNIFSQNLRILCKSRGSVSEVCRAIGVNRTQFSRYLAGDAFPRPDLLLRLCDYFEVDANILIRPVALSDEAPQDILASTLSQYAKLLPGTEYGVSQQHLPSGIYRQWRRSFMWPQYIFSGLCRISREGAVTRWKSYEPAASNYLLLDDRPAMPERGLNKTIQVRRHLGYAIRINQTVCILGAPPDGPVMRFSTLQPGFGGNQDLWSGYCALLRSPQENALTVVPSIFERLNVNTFSALLTLGRSRYFYEPGELPARLATLLMKGAAL